jgi:hypothetical protein
MGAAPAAVARTRYALSSAPSAAARAGPAISNASPSSSTSATILLPAGA